MAHFSARFHRWSPLLLRFMGANAFVQLLGVVTGILVVRGLPKEDYGYYSIQVGVLAAFVLVVDSGIAGAVLARSATTIEHPTRMGAVFAAGLRVQRKLAAIVGIVSLAFLAYLIWQLRAPVAVVIAGVVSLSLAIIPLANKSIFQAYHRLVQNYARLQIVLVASAVFRTIVVVALALTSSVDIFLLLLLNLLATFLEAAIMRFGVRKRVDWRLPSDQNFVIELNRTVRQTLPMSLSLVLQSQMLLFLLGLMGNAEVLAEVSALSRIAVVLAIFGPIIGDVGSGIIARTEPRRGLLSVRFALILGGFLGVGILVVATLWVFATPLVSILGAQYAGLEGPLVIIAGGTVGILTSEAMRVLNQARGWTRWSWVYIPLSAGWAALGVFSFDLADISQAAWWMALQAVVGLATQALVFIMGLRSLSKRDR